jgi:hypothetical protein
MSGVEFDRPSVERISTSPPLPIAWEESEDNASPKLKQPMNTSMMEAIEISSDEEELLPKGHESRMEDHADDMNNDADIYDDEASDSIDDTETGMDLDTFEDDYADENEVEEAETKYGEPSVADFTGMPDSNIYNEEDNSKSDALDAAVMNDDEVSRILELQSGNFTEATRSGYEDAYPTDFDEPVQSHGHGENVGDSSEVTQYSNKGDHSTGLGELLQFREDEGHAWNFSKIPEHSNREKYSQKLTDTQQITQEYADVSSASHAPFRTTKKQQIQSIDLTESDDDVEVQVQAMDEINVVELMEVQNSPMQGIQPADLSRLPKDRVHVQYKHTVEYEPTYHHKIASPCHTQFSSLPKHKPKVERKVNDSRHVLVLKSLKEEVKILPKASVTQPESAVAPSIFSTAARPDPHLSGQEIFEIPLVDLLDVQRPRNLINCTFFILILVCFPFNKLSFAMFTKRTYDAPNLVLTQPSSPYSCHIRLNLPRPLHIRRSYHPRPKVRRLGCPCYGAYSGEEAVDNAHGVKRSEGSSGSFTETSGNGDGEDEWQGEGDGKVWRK